MKIIPSRIHTYIGLVVGILVVAYALITDPTDAAPDRDVTVDVHGGRTR